MLILEHGKEAEPKQLTMDQLWGDPMNVFDETLNRVAKQVGYTPMGRDEMAINLSDIDTIDKMLFINLLAEQIHNTAKSKGFYDEVVSFPQAIALMHSELSEALEAHREGEPAERIAEELADTIIRILDTAAYQNYNVGTALVAKMEKNTKRPHKHGKRY